MNYNPTPKNEYCSSPAMLKAHRELVENVNVRVALRAALAQYSRELSEVRPTDDPAGYAGVALRLRGAHEFVQVLLNLAEAASMPNPIQSPNLNQNRPTVKG